MNQNVAWILDGAAGAKEAEAKDFPTFQPGKKEDSPPSTRDRSRHKLRQPLMSLQTLIKNVQELAKEEGEESEVKLREAIKILKGATFAIAGS